MSSGYLLPRWLVWKQHKLKQEQNQAEHMQNGTFLHVMIYPAKCSTQYSVDHDTMSPGFRFGAFFGALQASWVGASPNEGCLVSYASIFHWRGVLVEAKRQLTSNDRYEIRIRKVSELSRYQV